MKNPPLVLLPGVLNTAALWRDVAPHLSEEYELIFPEIHHHDNMVDLARHILAQISTPQFALAGFSMGGYVALEMLAQAPKRILAFALINSKAEPDTEAEQEHRRITLHAVKKANAKDVQFRGVTPRLIRKLLHPDHVTNDSITTLLYAMAEKVGRTGFLLQQQANLTRLDRRDALCRFKRPVLLLSGAAEQTIVPEKTFAACAQAPHAECLLIENAAHLSPLEAPEELLVALKGWLGKI